MTVYGAHLLQVTVEMKSEAVSFPAVTLCNYRNMDFEVINRINRQFMKGGQPSDHSSQNCQTVEDGAKNNATADYDTREYVDNVFCPGDNFMFQYLDFVSQLTNVKFSDRYESDSQVRRAVQVNYN